MYAVIESGGKQYRVSVGDRVKVESLKLDPGSKLNLEKVLFLADGDNIKVGTPYVGSHVEATVIGHGRGEKVRIFKLRRRKNSRQRGGHRQNFTELEIVSIDGNTARPVAEASQRAAQDAGKTAEAADTEAETADKEAEASVEKVAEKSIKTSADASVKKKTTKKKASKKTAKKS